MEKHRILREVLRNFNVFEAYCSQFGEYEVSHQDIAINFLDLQNCLNRLSKRKKEAVFYNVIQDMKQKDVAAVMGITTVSVGQYVEQAMIQVANDLWPDDVS